MATTVQNIPDELLVEILGKLPKKDLKNARRVCNLWSTAGAKWMFQRVYFAPRTEPMRTFKKIAAQPAFAQNVKELVYDGRLFLPKLGKSASYFPAFWARVIEEFDIYEDHTRNSFESADMNVADEVYYRSIWNMEKLGAGQKMEKVLAGDCKEFHMNVADSLVRYSRLLEQQERILKNSTDFTALYEGLTSFRNISKVSAIVDFAHCSDYYPCADNKNDENIDYHDWYSSRTKREFGLIVPPSRWCHRPSCQDGGEQDQEQEIKWDVRGVQNLFRAVSTHSPSLNELCIGSMDYQIPMTIFQWSVIGTKRVRTMFRGLTALKLHPYVAISDNGLECAEQRSCLELLMQETKELRVLCSSRWFLDDDSHESEEFDDENENSVWPERTGFGILRGKVWPHLTELILESGCVKAEDLMSIVRAHKETLRKLSLDRISLIGGEGWEHFSKEIGQVLELRYVRVSQLGHNSIANTSRSCRSWSSDSDERYRAYVRDMMQWALPELLEIVHDSWTIIGRLKAGSS